MISLCGASSVRMARFFGLVENWVQNVDFSFFNTIFHKQTLYFTANVYICSTKTHKTVKRINAIILGLSSINLFGESYSPQDEKSDAENIGSDWLAIGNDIRNAISQYERVAL